MKRTLGVCVLLLVLGASALYAQDSKSEEAAIRALIGSGQQKPTDDAVLWTGALKRPVVRPEKGEEFPGHEYSKRINQEDTVDVQRIEVAASNDLAYEFSYATVDYDLAASPLQHVAFKAAILRVWKKVNGQWNVAAIFSRPLDAPCERPTATSAK